MPLVSVLTSKKIKMNTNKFLYRNGVIISTVLLLTMLNFSCEKYVDIKRNSSQNLIQSMEDCQLLLNNYSLMNVEYPSDGETSSDDYYLNSAGYLSGALTATDRDLYVWSADAIRPGAQPQWLNPYQIVYQSNLVLETVQKLSASSDKVTLNDIKGQALFFRAYSFWQVAQLYAKPYVNSLSQQDLGIPMRLSSDFNAKSERPSVQQVYDQITDDLKEATTLLATTSSISSRPNKCAALALLARVYLSMEGYEDALKFSNAALELNNQLIDYNSISTSSTTPFARFNKEVIFHSVMTLAPALNPGSATSNVGKIDLSLVSSYSSNDLRSKIFLKPNSGANTGTYRFSGNYEPVSSGRLFNGLAVDEIYLIRAECYARNGNMTLAMNDLNTLLKTRWTNGTYIEVTASSADEALKKVLSERRKELLMRGQRWSDLRRLNRDSQLAITLTRTANGVVYTLPPNDPKYTLLIPNEVIATSGIPQNIR